MDSNVNVFLFEADIMASDAEVIVIPHSSNGFLTGGFRKIMEEKSLLPYVPANAEPGDVKVVQQPYQTDPKHSIVAFVCTNDAGDSSYSIIRQIIYNLVDQLQKELTSSFSKIACPILGGGGANLEPVKVFQLIGNAFKECLPADKSVAICVNNAETAKRIMSLAPDKDTRSSLLLAFVYSLAVTRTNSWAGEMLSMTEYYMEKAILVYKEFIDFRPASPSMLSDLKSQFSQKDKVFQSFIKEFDPARPEYQFLELCGRLVAYVDRHAYNKSRWNEYEDKRTLAQSSVTQTNWISNFIAFKEKGNDWDVLSPSIRNAFQYLDHPDTELSMLSEGHRSYTSLKLLGHNYQKEKFCSEIYKLFRHEDLRCKNPLNEGIFYTRLLYSPSIKMLWLSPRKATPVVKQKGVAHVSDKPQTTEESTEEIKNRRLQALLYSDAYAEVDLLNYEIYASAIAAFIRSPLTKPPLTIGIIAPWGKGKTSIMHFLSKKITNSDKPEKLPPVKENAETTYGGILDWLSDKTGNMLKINTVSYPAIWFNAWKFQKNEQVWAAFAHEVITQLAAKLDSVDREKFWFRLNIKRLEKDKIKRDIIFKFIQHAVIPITVTAGGLLVSFLLKLFSAGWVNIVSPGLALISLAVGFLWSAMKTAGAKKEKPDIDIAKYVMQPEYKTKMGYYAAVEEDLRHALELIADGKSPPVIFIDDLDRCSPTVIAELLEAINLFMSGGISNCYFIIGLDAQIVAAALDSAYDKIGTKAGNVEKFHGSLGWYFMEKFIQLQFNIPTLTGHQSTKILETWLGGQQQVENPDIDQQALLKQYKDLQDTMETIDDLDLIFTPTKTDLEIQISSFAPEKVTEFQEKIISRAINNYEVNETELEDIIENVSSYLKSSPRDVKRFANLFMFYQFLKYTNSCQGLRNVSSGTLGRWLIVMIRWPQLIRAIQWNDDNDFLSGVTPKDRADHFEKMVESCKTAKQFREKIDKETNGKTTWQGDEDLFKFFKESEDDEEKLSNAVECGLL